jgi:nicotinate-nucleotide pyrophosphorylase (carboxylating)
MRTVDHLIELALDEDIGSGDITTDALVAPEAAGAGVVTAKEPLVVAGLWVAEQVFQHLDPSLQFTSSWKDGDRIPKGEIVFEIQGSLSNLLIGERTALNFLQRLSGIATFVRSYLETLGDPRIRLVDTRKTTPGWRWLEKYAVRVGGAANHRMGLYDGVLIKDNHIVVCGGITQAIAKARNAVSHLIKIEVEVEDLPGVEEALAAGAEVIMLDNMENDQIRAAMERIGGKALVEISGGVTKEQLAQLADLGVDIISAGALTHSAPSVDMSMAITQVDDPIRP